MRPLLVTLTAVVLAMPAFHAQAQTFPEGATTPDAAEVKRRLDDRVFKAQLADGTSWRLQYAARGHFFVDTSTGGRGKGEWRAEDGKLCSQPPGRNWGCNEVRLVNDVLYLKRDSGEIIQFIAQ
jgi:hypothetical protein